MRIRSKFNGKCSQCGKSFAAGADIDYEKGQGARCISCFEQPDTRDLHQLADALGFVPSDDSPLIKWTHFCYRTSDEDRQSRLFA